MCDCRVNSSDDCAVCNSGCSPRCYECNRSCLTEYPKQNCLNVEEKFSNWVPPSFLCKDPKRSCGCNTKSRKISKKKCTCKAKNSGTGCRSKSESSCGYKSDCKKVSEDDINCPNECRSRNTGPNGRNCADANDNLMCQDQRPCPVAPHCVGDPFCEGNDWAAIPAAGMPSKKDVRFDPCTGVEYSFYPEPARPANSGQQGRYGPCNQPSAVVPPQPNEMFPYCYPNMCCAYPNPTVPSNFNNCPCFEKSGEANTVGSTCDFLNDDDLFQSRKCPCILRDSDKRKATKKCECNCNVKWSEATPKVIERICDSLGVPNPPNSSNILLPITMSAKGSDQDQSSNELNRGRTTKLNNATVRKPTVVNGFRPTRSCGCNTEKQEEFRDDCVESDKNANENNAAANNNCRGVCNSSMYCHQPQYTCCYNPFTGYYFWSRCCCCCNSCNCCNPCNTLNPFNPHCGSSCPLPNQEPISQNKEEGNKAEEQSKSKRNSGTLQKSNKSKSANDRTTAGSSVSLPQPTNDELHNQWLSFQNSVLMPPPLPPQMPSPNFPRGPSYIANIIPTYCQAPQFYPGG